MAKMLGEHYHFCGPQGLKCKCCNVNPPPGKKRRTQRRVTKHSERNTWRQNLSRKSKEDQ